MDIPKTAASRRSLFRLTTVRFPPNPVSQGRWRVVRIQEVGRTQQMTDKGAKPPIL
jgi:hypothetical protein